MEGEEDNESSEPNAGFNFTSPNLPMRTPGSRGSHPEDSLIHVLPRFNRCYNDFVSLINERIARFTRLNVNQLLALGFVARAHKEGQSTSPGDVAHTLGVSNAAVTKIMDTLERRELCVRLRVPNQKTKSIVLTAKGERVIEQASQLLDSTHDTIHDHKIKHELVELARYIIEEYAVDDSPESTSGAPDKSA